MAEQKERMLSEYELDAHGLRVRIRIADRGEFVPMYEVTVPGLGEATRILLLSLRQELLSLVPIDPTRIEDKEYVQELTDRYREASNLVIDKYLPGTPPEAKKTLIAYIINVMLGLGDLEAPLADDNLEEIAVNNSKEPIWVFHKNIGWCKTNMRIHSEELIYNYAEEVGRRVGRGITNLAPFMDAVLPDGSRVNATLYPISQKGNTMTIRKYSKNPWTMPAMIENHTLPKELAALVWTCMQNEINILISGGTATGKTSFLNAMSIFIPANRRVVSVEETRELTLPVYLHWIPMLTRQANPEGRGEIRLYDLTINALRQRPDVILVGEVRVKSDAETLFEAIHTGHAVYSTVHADNAQDTIVRMTTPPIDSPKLSLNAIGVLISLFRHRRLGIRRVLEMGEILRSGDTNVLYRWNLRTDSILQIAEMSRLAELLSLYGGLTLSEINQDIAEKAKVLDWMVKNNVTNIDDAGYVVANYYRDKESVMKRVNADSAFKSGMFGSM